MNIHYDIIVHHQFCADGSASQWAAKLNMQNSPIIIGVATGMSHTLDFNQFKNKNVLFADFAPSGNDFDTIVAIASYLTILDHHKSAIDIYIEKFNFIYNNGIIDHKESNFHIYFNMNKSACQIVWEYFNSDPIPWFLDYIADRDLWQWKLANSEDINAGMNDKKLYNDEGFQSLLLYNNYDICQLSNHGKVINTKYKLEVDNICKLAQHAISTRNNITYNVWLITCSNYYKSEVGNKLSTIPFSNGIMPDFVVIWQPDPKSSDIWISLRNTYGFDLTIVSKQYDVKGGGHERASGFTLQNENIEDVFQIIN